MKKVILISITTLTCSLFYLLIKSKGEKQIEFNLPYIKAIYSMPVTYDPAQMNDSASLIRKQFRICAEVLGRDRSRRGSFPRA